MLYYNLSSYFRKKYGRRLKKICIDGGFSCPNRDGKCGTGGCIYCGERGAGEHITPKKSIGEQVTDALGQASEDDLFVAYFQSFTNTYADLDTLRSRYDEALTDERIKVLSIGTRPDCIDESVVALLSEYTEKREVWVELGLQSANDETAKIINRGYPLATFEQALSLLKNTKVKVIVHLIHGLPGETDEDFKHTADYISSLDLFGVKLHSIYVMKNTALADMYLENRYTPPTFDEFVSSAAYLISHLSPSVVIHRLTGDAPKDSLLAPEWNKDKNAILEGIRRTLEKMGLCQGSLYPSP